MKAVTAFLFAAIMGLAAFECAVRGDEVEKIPGRDNPVLKTILAPEMRIGGVWIGVIRRGYEEHTVTIDLDPDEKGDYRLKFYSWTEKGGAIITKRTAKVAEGIITLNEPTKAIGVAKSPFSVLYAVRADGKDFLIPSVNAEELKTVDDVKPRIAYQFQRRTTR